MTMRTERHHWTLHQVPPWRIREVARDTGRKCERSQYPKHYRATQRAEAKSAGRRAFQQEIRDAAE